MFAEAAHSGQLHSEVDVFIAFGFRVCFEEHRHAEPVALLKRHVHDAPHIPLPLIRFAHADQADEETGPLLPVEPLVKPRFALCHDFGEAKKRFRGHGAEHPLRKQQHGAQAEPFAGPLIGCI